MGIFSQSLTPIDSSDNPERHQYLEGTSGARPNFAMRRFGTALALSALALLAAGGIDRARSEDEVVCADMNYRGDLTARRVTIRLRDEGASIDTFERVSDAYDANLTSAEIENFSSYDASVCASVRHGVTGELMDHLLFTSSITASRLDTPNSDSI